MPVGARWWHQGRNAIDQLQWRQSQLAGLGTTLVGAAIDQIVCLFAQPIHGKGWARATSQQPLQRSTVVRLDADTGIDRETTVLVQEYALLDAQAPRLESHRRNAAGRFDLYVFEGTDCEAELASIGWHGTVATLLD